MKKIEKAEIIKNVLNYKFDESIATRMTDFRYRYRKLIEFARSNNGLLLFNNEIQKKISSKEEDFFTQIRNTYRKLQCLKVLMPGLNENWLLYGKGKIFDNTSQEISKTDKGFMSRFKELIEQTTNVHQISIEVLVNYINAILIDKNKDRAIVCRHIFENREYSVVHEKSEFEAVENYRVKNKDIFICNLIENFDDLKAAMNKFKEIIPGFNESWLMFGEGDMFENKN